MFKLIVFVSLMFTHLSADVFPLVSAISRRPYTIPPWPKPSEAILRLREEIRRQAEIKELKARRDDYYKTYFENIIKNHEKDINHTLQIDTFAPIAKQMKGLGFFIPEENVEKQPIFVAKKRPYKASVSADISTERDDDFSTAGASSSRNIDYFTEINDDSHTERQLLKRLLNDMPADIHGTAFIYTYSAPCNAPGFDSNDLSCVDYYANLSERLPNLNFKIFFMDTSINPNIKGDRYKKLIDFIIRYIDNQSKSLSSYAESASTASSTLSSAAKAGGEPGTFSSPRKSASSSTLSSLAKAGGGPSSFSSPAKSAASSTLSSPRKSASSSTLSSLAKAGGGPSSFSSPAKSAASSPAKSSSSNIFSSPAAITISIEGKKFFRLTHDTGVARLEYNLAAKHKQRKTSGETSDAWITISSDDEMNKIDFISIVNAWLTALETKKVEYAKEKKFRKLIDAGKSFIKSMLSNHNLQEAEIRYNLRRFTTSTTFMLESLITANETSQEIRSIRQNNEAINTMSRGVLSEESKIRIKIYIDSISKHLSTLSAEKAESEASNVEKFEMHEEQKKIVKNLAIKTALFNSVFSPYEKIEYHVIEDSNMKPEPGPNDIDEYISYSAFRTDCDF